MKDDLKNEKQSSLIIVGHKLVPVRHLLAAAGVAFSEGGGEVRIECPHDCGGAQVLTCSINVGAEKYGVYFCHHCNETGDLTRLAEVLEVDLDDVIVDGEAERILAETRKAPAKINLPIIYSDDVMTMYTAALMKDCGADGLKTYLNRRCISDETIEKQRLGLHRAHWFPPQRPAGPPIKAQALVIPFLKGRVCVYTTFRTYLPPYDGAKKLPHKKGPVPLYNAEILGSAAAGRDVYICEGEMDTLAALSAGMIAVGVPSAKSCNADHVTLVATSGAGRIILAQDNDEEGREGRQKWTVALKQAGKPSFNFNLIKGCKDLNEQIMKYGRKSLGLGSG
jgi:Toprim domain-containing protein